MGTWKQVVASEFIDFNPKETLKKGTIAPKISMDILAPFTRKVSSYTQESYNGGTKFRNQDTIMARITPCLENGKTSMVDILPEDTVGFGSTEYIVFRARSGISDSKFVYYLACSNVIRDIAIKSMVGSSGRQRVQQSVVNNIEFMAPALEEQKRIAAVLSSLDDKIELNNVINENLEEQAQALFKSWFVDFEPFGGAMPSDWEAATLGTIATIKTNSFNPLKNNEILLEHYSIPAYDEKHYPVFESSMSVKSNKYILSTHSVMISKLNPDTKRIWRPLCLSAHPVCSTEFIVYEANIASYKDFVCSIIDSKAFSDYLCSHTTGSTNSRQRATPKDTLDFPFFMPPAEKVVGFCGLVSPLYDLIGKNIAENQSLAKLRDALLPKLMSGEINVSNVSI